MKVSIPLLLTLAKKIQYIDYSLNNEFMGNNKYSNAIIPTTLTTASESACVFKFKVSGIIL